MTPRCYRLTIPGQFTSWLALLDPVTDGGRTGWMALDISYREGDHIPSVTYLPVGEADISPYEPVPAELMRREAMHGLAILQAAFEVATEDGEVRA